MEDKLIRLTVNGRNEAVVIRPLATLQDVLRDNLQLNAVKSGCGQGGCGSCSVLVDGELRLSCLTLAEQAVGAEVTTLEGLNETNAIVPLQRAFVENYAAAMRLLHRRHGDGSQGTARPQPGAEPR